MSLVMYCSSLVSFLGWLYIFLTCHWIVETKRWLRTGWSNMSVPSDYAALRYVHLKKIDCLL
uniref:Secreted protein n=1 Tax=Mesocestoides corti TaxID=53468 RepID=A0A5K3EMZ6_MESCO